MDNSVLDKAFEKMASYRNGRGDHIRFTSDEIRALENFSNTPGAHGEYYMKSKFAQDFLQMKSVFINPLIKHKNMPKIF